MIATEKDRRGRHGCSPDLEVGDEDTDEDGEPDEDLIGDGSEEDE